MPRDRSRSASPSRHRHRRRSRSAPRHQSPRRSESRRRHRNRSKRREMPKNRIPENWDDVAKMGTIVATSRFVPLRVPLDAKYLPQFEHKKEDIWTPKDFLETQKEQDLNVKLLIDLTNTLKYYNGEDELKDSGVEYVKLKIEGFNGPPAARDVAKFITIVDEFIANEPEGNIAVHCTHGLNRTGYLIVTYLVKRMNFTVTEALEAFKVARPPGLIKHMYVEDLYKRLGEGEEVKLPELPEWARTKYSMQEKKKSGHRSKHSNRRNHDKKENSNPKHKRFEES